jgi:hypothetical protein
MAVYTVIAHQRLDDYAVVQTLTNTPVEPGQSITLAGLGHTLNGTHTVLFCPQYAFTGVDGTTGEWLYDFEVPRANQVLFYDAGDELEWSTAVPTGTLTWTQTCTWITNANVEEWLGISVATANDTAFITKCVSAANAFAYRRRVESGYLEDSLSTSPGGDVTLGTIMYAALLYRERGSADSFASFDSMGTFPVPSALGRILQLLGVGRPQVA